MISPLAISEIIEKSMGSKHKPFLKSSIDRVHACNLKLVIEPVKAAIKARRIKVGTMPLNEKAYGIPERERRLELLLTLKRLLTAINNLPMTPDPIILLMKLKDVPKSPALPNTFVHVL